MNRLTLKSFAALRMTTEWREERTGGAGGDEWRD